MANDDRGSGYGNQQRDTAGAGTAQATEPAAVKVVRNEDGAVEVGTWKTLPAGFEQLTTREEIVEGLMNYHAMDLREKIADLALNKF
jgi:uncharacterized cupin superfamily protein